jgi:glutathione synthase/RimK-type ligase-like ATP-grasp enzyme
VNGYVLLWGLLEDRTMRSVHDQLRAHDVPLVFVNHAAVDRTRVRITADRGLTHILSHEQSELALDAFTAAYLRPYDARDYADADELHAARVHHLLAGWAAQSAALVVNRPAAEATNHSKLAQARTIAATGLLTPESIVTNETEEMRAFLGLHGRGVLKSLSAVRSVVRELSVDDVPSRPIGPAFLQRLIPGRNVRVHVVGDAAFACAIDSDAIDYRYGSVQLNETTLPTDVAARCINLACRLGLAIAGIDLIVTPDGEWYCLEANPNPGFSAYDEVHSGAVAAALARLLAAGAAG